VNAPRHVAPGPAGRKLRTQFGKRHGMRRGTNPSGPDDQSLAGEEGAHDDDGQHVIRATDVSSPQPDTSSVQITGLIIPAITMMSSCTRTGDGGAFRGGARRRWGAQHETLACPPGALVCPGKMPLCVLGGPCVSWAVLVCPGPSRPGPGSAPATAGRDDLDDRVRRQQQVAEQRVCRRDTKRPRHLEGVQVLSQQSAPGGIRTPNLLIRNTEHRLLSGSESCPGDIRVALRCVATTSIEAASSLPLTSCAALRRAMSA